MFLSIGKMGEPESDGDRFGGEPLAPRTEVLILDDDVSAWTERDSLPGNRLAFLSYVPLLER
jgi:hypothetical protein